MIKRLEVIINIDRKRYRNKGRETRSRYERGETKAEIEPETVGYVTSGKPACAGGDVEGA